MFELTVTVKGEDSSFKQKFLVYEDVLFKEDDPVLKDYIAQALANSKIQPESVKVRANMEIQ